MKVLELDYQLTEVTVVYTYEKSLDYFSEMTLAQFSKLNFSDLDAYTVPSYRILSKIGVKDRLFKVDMFLKNRRPYNS